MLSSDESHRASECQCVFARWPDECAARRARSAFACRAESAASSPSVPSRSERGRLELAAGRWSPPSPCCSYAVTQSSSRFQSRRFIYLMIAGSCGDDETTLDARGVAHGVNNSRPDRFCLSFVSLFSLFRFSLNSPARSLARNDDDDHLGAARTRAATAGV